MTGHQPIGTMQQLRDYVNGGQTTVPDGYGKFDITHNLLKSQFKEIQLALDSSIADVKDRLSRIAGTNLAYMEIYLNGTVLLGNDNYTLRQYNAQPLGNSIHIVDLDPHSNAKNGAYEDVSQVKKYVMSEEEYNKRDNSVRAIKAQRAAQRAEAERTGQAAPTMSKTGISEQSNLAPLESLEEVQQRCTVGSRCEVRPGGRRGVVQFVGHVPHLAGEQLVWVGVALDEPVGKHDGTVGGKKYFTAQPRSGIFAKPIAVEMGDFPERDPFDDEEDDSSKQAEEQKTAEGKSDDMYEEL